MPRTTTATMRTTLEAANTHIFWMGEFDLEGGALYLHTDLGNIAWGGHTWQGTGILGEVAPIAEDSSLNPTEYACTLSGIDSNLISEARQGHHIGRSVKIWLAARNLSTGTLIASPVLVLSGVIDRISIGVNTEEASITLQVQDDRVLFERPAGIWLTHEQQQERNPGDGILEFAAELVNKEIPWDGGAPLRHRHDPNRDRDDPFIPPNRNPGPKPDYEIP